MRACLFQPGERQRLDALVDAAAADAERMRALQTAAPIELAIHAAASGSWDRYKIMPPVCVSPSGFCTMQHAVAKFAKLTNRTLDTSGQHAASEVHFTIINTMDHSEESAQVCSLRVYKHLPFVLRR